MTVFGKILTFIILVLALAQAALHVMFHIAQTNYAAQNLKQDASLVAANAQIDTLNRVINDLKQESQGAIAKEQNATKEVQTEVVNLKRANNDQTTEIRMLKNELNGKVVILANNNTDVKALEKGIAQLDQAVKARDEKLLEMIKVVNESRQSKVKAEIEANAFKLRNEQLVDQIQEKEKELARSKSFGAGIAGAMPGGAAGGVAAAKNPPPANVEGLITKTDPTSGMVSVSIGSDAGVIKGHTLEVFRLNPPKYLGTIRILEAKPNEAVGKPVNKPLGQIQQGDRVAAKILGG